MLRNYIGQLRLYSLADLVLLLVACRASTLQLLGSVALWLSFLLLLEEQHRHEGRRPFPKGLWLAPLAFGCLLYGRVETVVFVALSYLYGLKTVGRWAMISPFLRGGQTLVLVGGILGYQDPLVWIAAALITLRNFLGDIRDIEKDSKASLQTWPVIWKMQGRKRVHLIGLLATSLVWWRFTNLDIGWLLLVWLVETTTYELTPR